MNLERNVHTTVGMECDMHALHEGAFSLAFVWSCVAGCLRLGKASANINALNKKGSVPARQSVPVCMRPLLGQANLPFTPRHMLGWMKLQDGSQTMSGPE